MPQTTPKTQQQLDRLSAALESGTFVDVKRMLNGLPAGDVAHLLESTPPRYRHVLWQLVDLENPAT